MVSKVLHLGPGAEPAAPGGLSFFAALAAAWGRPFVFRYRFRLVPQGESFPVGAEKAPILLGKIKYVLAGQTFFPRILERQEGRKASSYITSAGDGTQYVDHPEKTKPGKFLQNTQV